MTTSLAEIGERLRWKAKRAIDLPRNILRRAFLTRYYDLVLSKKKRTSAGKIAKTPRAAIFLIFPRAGVKASHLATLRYLVSKGCATTVVSNVPLHDGDRAALLGLCHQLIERPNFGYDFGGYRDGVLSVRDDLADLESLTLLNDSCWFPLPGSSDWLDDARALGVDFAGAASNYGMTPQRPGHYVPQRWDYRSDNPDFHYCSFALRISGRLLRDPGFLRFWTHFNLSNDKVEVVQRGEVGLSQWVIQHGFSHAATLDIATLDKDLAGFSSERIRTFVEELIIPEEPELRAEKLALLGRYDGSGDWGDDARRFILLAIAQTGVSYVLPEFTVREKRFPFLKKSPLWLETEAAESTLRIARDLAGTDGEIILSEAAALKR